jgi:hypothetical protein
MMASQGGEMGLRRQVQPAWTISTMIIPKIVNTI